MKSFFELMKNDKNINDDFKKIFDDDEKDTVKIGYEIEISDEDNKINITKLGE